MKKIFLLIVLLAAIIMLAPANRGRILQWVGPISESSERRAAERALQAMAADIERSSTYPQPGELKAWLNERQLSAADPWGSAYYMELLADSFVVASPGPDTRLRTDDDLRLARRRAETDPGALIVDYQPPPPPAAAGRTAKTKALEVGRRQ